MIGSASGVGAAWLAAHHAEILEARDYVDSAAGQRRDFAFFTDEQAVEVEAMAAQIIPTDETPGAKEARVVAFIDRALATFESDRQEAYKEGLKELASKTQDMYPGKGPFSALKEKQQIQLLTAIEDTDFFNLVRTHTVTGFFASPVHGGNYGKAGWELIGYDDALDHTPPFGYYDALPESRR